MEKKTSEENSKPFDKINQKNKLNNNNDKTRNRFDYKKWLKAAFLFLTKNLIMLTYFFHVPNKWQKAVFSCFTKIQKVLMLIWHFLNFNIISNITAGLIIMVIAATCISNQQLKMESHITVESIDKVEGNKSILWNFDFQPTQIFNWGIFKKVFGSPTNTIVCSLHFQRPPGSTSINLSDYRSINFQAKSSQKNFEISEVNLFSITNKFSSDPLMIQYVYNRAFLPLKLSNKWKRYSIQLDDFKLAEWTSNYKEIDDSQRKGSFNYLNTVYAFGFDMKTNSDPVKGKIWIDDVCLIKNHGGTVQLGDTLTFNFQDKLLNWITECMDIGR